MELLSIMSIGTFVGVVYLIYLTELIRAEIRALRAETRALRAEVERIRAEIRALRTGILIKQKEDGSSHFSP